MSMVPFFTRCPEVAEAEFRTARVIEDAHIPPGEYGFLELYCDEAGCDCRRVFIHVITPTMESEKPLATINFGWESEDFYREWMHGFEDDDFIRELKGPSLAPMTQQNDLAPYFLKLFESMLQDPAYAERFRRHYRLFREKIETKHSRQAVRKSGANTRAALNAPCPCGQRQEVQEMLRAAGVIDVATEWSDGRRASMGK